MEIQKDFKEFFALFNAHKVEYVVGGGYALAFHGPTSHNPTVSCSWESRLSASTSSHP